MNSALYYPHITLSNEDLLRDALLLWDEVKCIVPNDRYPILTYGKEPSVIEAQELLLQPLVPSEDCKRNTHERIRHLLENPLPDWFFVDRVLPDCHYQIFDDKFLSDTWDMLKRSKLATRGDLLPNGWTVTAGLGLTVMSVLADECAGTIFAPITDEVASYSLMQREITQLSQGDFGNDDKAYDRLVTVTLEIIGFDKILFGDLVQLRQKEAGGDYTIRDLRHNYRRRMDETVQAILTEARNNNDRQEIERIFRQDMERDLAAIGEEMKRNVVTALCKKPVAVGVLIAAGLVAPSPLSGILAVSALGTVLHQYRRGRHRILQNHPMSWLFTQDLARSSWY